MAVVSIRVTDEEKQTMQNFADFYGQSLSKLMRDSFFEKIEDEYDMRIVAEYERDKAAGKLKLHSLEDVLAKNKD